VSNLKEKQIVRNKIKESRVEKTTHTHTETSWHGIMPPPIRTYCSECGKSLICESCGQFMWNKIYIIDNAVLPWYFCSKECNDKFLQKLKDKKNGR